MRINQNETDATKLRAHFTAMSAAGAMLPTSSTWFWDWWLSKNGAAPTQIVSSDPFRGVTDATATATPTTPSSMVAGDLAIVFLWTEHTAVPTHTIQSNYTEIISVQDSDSTTSARLSIAYHNPSGGDAGTTLAGAQVLTPYTVSAGTSYAGVLLLKKGYWSVTGIQSASTSDTTATAPNPPSITLNQKKIVLAIAGWRMSSAAVVTPTAPSNYTLKSQIAGSIAGELAVAYRLFKTAVASAEDPATWGDDVTPDSSANVTIAIKLTPATQEGVGYDDDTNTPGMGYVQLVTGNSDTTGELKLMGTNTGSVTDCLPRPIAIEIVAAGGDATAANQTSILARLPSALVSGRMDSTVGAYQTGLAPLQPTTAGRTLDVTAGGEAGLDWSNIGAPTTTVNLSGTTIKTATDLQADTDDIQSRIPTALVGGRMSSYVGAMAADSLTASALATDAAAEIAAAVAAGVTPRDYRDPLALASRWMRSEPTAAKRNVLITVHDRYGAPLDARCTFSATGELLVDPSTGVRVAGAGTLANVTKPLTFADTTFTADASTDVCTAAAHGRRTGDLVQTTNTGGALPGALAALTNYYVIWRSASTLQLASSLANALTGTAINITSAGTGTHKLHAVAGSTQLVDGQWRYTATQVETDVDASYFGVVLSKACSTGAATAVDDTAGTSVLTGSGFLSRHVGRRITVAGFANGGNNGTFTITAVSVDGTTATYANASAVDETHAATWTIDDDVPEATGTAIVYEREDSVEVMTGVTRVQHERLLAALNYGKVTDFEGDVYEFCDPVTGVVRLRGTVDDHGRQIIEIVNLN